jgi:hypothetical protein
MSDTILDCNKNDNDVVIVYKAPEYLINARRNYYNTHKSDPKYKQKKLENVKAWREKNREHVNELERLRRQKKREEQNAKKSVPVIEPVTEDSKPVNQTDVPKDIPLDKTIVAAMENMVLDAVETVQEPEKNIEKPKAKRGRKPKCDVVI